MADIPMTPAGDTAAWLTQIDNLMNQANNALGRVGNNAILNQVATSLVNGLRQARAALNNGELSTASDILANLGQLESQLGEVGGDFNLVAEVSSLIAQCNSLSRDIG